MHILIVTPYYKPAYIYGGPVQAIAAICEGLQREGEDVTVFTTTADGKQTLNVSINTLVDVNGVPVKYFPLVLKGAGCFYAPTLGQETTSQMSQFDIAMINTLWSYPLWPTAMNCIRSNVPYVVSVHGQLNPWALAQRNFKKKIYLNMVGKYFIEHAHAIHCSDESEAVSVKQLGFEPATFVIPHAIRADEHGKCSKPIKWRHKFGIPDKAFILFFLGRLTEIKRPDLAIDVLHEVLSANLDTYLLFAGPDIDGMTTKLRLQAQDAGCSDRVHFAGLLAKEDVISVLAEVNLLLMPSEIQENFGMSALEALASGVPILVSPGIPVGKLAQAAGAGRVVPCSRDDWAKVAVNLLSQPETLKSMGLKGRELAQNHFDISIIAKQFSEQFRAIFDTGKPISQKETTRI